MQNLRKTRADAWGGNFSDEVQMRLYVEGSAMSYQIAKAWAKKDLKIDLPGPSCWYRFLQRMREEDAALRLAKASDSSREIGSIARQAAIGDTDLIKSLQSLGATAALQGDVDTAKEFISMATKLANVASRAGERRSANEKLKILQAKMDSVRKVCETAKKKGGLTEETLKRIEEAAGLL